LSFFDFSTELSLSHDPPSLKVAQSIRTELSVWSSQLLVETLPPSFVRCLELRGTHAAEMTVPPCGIVEVLDVLS